MQKLVGLFNRVFVFVPLGLASFLAIVYLCGGWGVVLNGFGLEHFALPQLDHWGFAVLSVACLFLFICVLLQGTDRMWKSLENRYVRAGAAAFLIFLLTAALRFAFVYLFRDEITLYSDFQRSWEMAQGHLDGNLEYYTLFPSYLNFSVYERLVSRLFGASYIHVLELNAFWSGVTAAALFGVALLTTRSHTVSALAGFLYAVYPTNIVYTASGTPEFLTVAFNTLGLLGLVWFLRAQGVKKYFGIFTAGVLLGIGTSYKSFAVIILIAFGMTVLVKEILEKRQDLKKRVRAWLLVGLSLVLLFGGYKLAGDAILHHTEKVYNQELSTAASMPHFLLVGLNTQGEGQIHYGTLSRAYYQEYLQNGCNFEEAKEHAFALLKQDWSENKSDIVPLFLKKLVWAWQDDFRPILYFNQHEGIQADSLLESAVYNYSNNILPAVSQICYFLMLVFALAGSVRYIREKSIRYPMELCFLIVFGYFCLMLLSEAQSRYKCLILPNLCLLAAIGMDAARQSFCKQKIRKENAR